MLLAAFCCVVALSAFSPFFALLLGPATLLHSVNHYSDAIFRGGGFIIMLLAVGLGAEAMIGRGKRLKRYFLCIFGISSLFSVGLYWLCYALDLYTDNANAPVFFGFPAAMTFIFAIAIMWHLNATNSKRRKKTLILIFALAALDLSTTAFWHCRNIDWPLSHKFEDAPVDKLGAAMPDRGYTESLLTVGAVKKLKDAGLPADKLPRRAFSSSAGTQWTEALYSDKTPTVLPYIMLDPALADDPVFGKFFSGRESGELTFSMKLLKRTYNTVALTVDLSSDAIFFWRDAWSPYWKAKVNGADAPIAKAMVAFKAVALPAGESTVEFDFSPGALPYALALAYIIFFSVAAYVLVVFCRLKKSSA